MLKHTASIPGPQALKPLVLLLLALLFATAVAGATLSLTRAQTANGVYDTDGDKLIEISYLEQLAAIGYDPNGDGEADNTVAAAFYSLAFPVEAGESVCDSDCTGYELAKSLDFKKAGSYSSGVINPLWTDALGGSGWVPIIHRAADGTKKGYAATFEGNGYTIANLYSKEALNDTDTGLFAILESGATVKKPRADCRRHRRRVQQHRRAGWQQQRSHHRQLLHRHSKGQGRHRRAGRQQQRHGQQELRRRCRYRRKYQFQRQNLYRRAGGG